jgi:type I restriction enzyme S subunit
MYEREITGSEVMVTSLAITKSSLPLLQPGAILIAIVGQGKTLGHVAMLRCEATISRHVGYVQPNTALVVPTFLRAFLESQYEGLRQIASGNGSTRAALTAGNLRPLPVPLPPTLDEQREIVAVLDAIDRKIDLHKRKRAVLDELFKSLLHKLMTGEIRVADLDLSAFEAAEPAGEAA